MRARLKCISCSEIHIGGELKARIERNFDRMEEPDYQNPQVFRGNDDWPGDLEGRTVLALTLLAQAAHRPSPSLDDILLQFPRHLNSLGFFGEIHDKGVVSEQQLSGHGWVLRGLCEHYEWTKSPRTLSMIETIVRNLFLPTRGKHKDYPITPTARKRGGGHAGKTIEQQGGWLLSSDIGCDFIFMDGAIHAWQILKDFPMVDVIEEMVERYLQMDMVAIGAQTHSILTGMRGLLRYHGETGHRYLVNAVEDRFRKYKALAQSENYGNWNWFGRPTWTEPCAIVDSFDVALSLWQLTGHSLYLEDAHWIYYNALGHAQRPNGGYGCDTCAGAAATRTQDGSVAVSFSPFIKISADEASCCCTMRGAEGLTRAVKTAYLLGDHEVLLPFFFDNEATWELGDQTLRVRETTGYPASGAVRLDILDACGPEAATPTTLRFFAPSWSRNHRIFVNGTAIATVQDQGFLSFGATLQRGTVVEMTSDHDLYTMPAFNPTTPGGYFTFRSGPRILACDSREEDILSADAEVERDSGGLFGIKGTNTRLSPIDDMLNRSYVKTQYSRQILFRRG